MSSTAATTAAFDSAHSSPQRLLHELDRQASRRRIRVSPARDRHRDRDHAAGQRRCLDQSSA